MKELFKTVKSNLRNILIFMALAYPILGVAQWLVPNYTPLDTYNGYLKELLGFILEYGDWILIVYLSIQFSSSPQLFYEAAETIRMNRLIAEVKRWSRTPYISPVHFFYLMAPQPAYNPMLHAQVKNTFNTEVMNLFRNRIYVNAEYMDDFPGPKVTWTQAVGSQLIFSVLAGMTFITGFFIVLGSIKSPELWFTGIERFFIPILVTVSALVGKKLFAMLRYGSGELLEEAMLDYFGEKEPRITWREMFPDRQDGKNLVLAWQANIEVQQRQYNYFKNRPLPNGNIMNYDNPLLPPYPFPQNTMPEWANELAERLEDKKVVWRYEANENNRKMAKQSKGKVVLFNKKKAK
ncbi:hypothetical protein [Aneurinibacillus tyrosinisolvens]|uniref:hypothetical protein n=1 Tax=Aneurinibacillus tyrosinisolvens TaxID=1443435 RepID=UPI00063F4FA0|nr:hypothetical protein [Aneurinibacillus tyrosinisolvens]